MTVKQKQCLLYFLGYYVGEIDGDWGTLSRTACKAFQKDFGGLTIDGIAGNQTVKAMKHAVAYGMPVKKTETATSGDFWDEIKYFKRSEFACKCGKCGGYPVEPKEKLIRVADQVRKNLGGMATVSSGVRCATHNANVGGVTNSRHLSGKAMDFCIAGKTAAQVLAEVNKHKEIRYEYAIDSRYVHMDIE